MTVAVADGSELMTVATRLADRLRVVGPRFAARDGVAAAAVLDDVRAVLQDLADLGADAEGISRRPVPVLGAYALGDQVLVLSRDVDDTGDPAAAAAAADLLGALAARL